MNNTIKALIKRGIDSITAEKVYKKEYSLNKLRITDDKKLLDIGLTQEQINLIKDESRPPIPEETVNKLLYESNFTCCICKDSSNGIIIHHIDEWHISKSHDQNNLVVLCPNHHDKAHSHSDLTLNLTKDRLIDFKEKWIEEVKHKTALALKEKQKASNNRYDYFNIKRLLELCRHYGISNNNTTFNYLRDINILDKNGNINSYIYWKTASKVTLCLFHPFECNYLYLYMKELMDLLLECIEVKDLDTLWDKKTVSDFIHEGDFITFSGGVYLKNISKSDGDDQPRLIYSKKRGIKVESEINAFWATSSSSYSYLLKGHQSKTFIGQILSIDKTIFGINIKCSTLGIGNNFNQGI